MPNGWVLRLLSAPYQRAIPLASSAQLGTTGVLARRHTFWILALSATDPALEGSSLPPAHSAESGATVAAGKLPPWQTGDLPPAPTGGWTTWLRLLGPGVLLAGASIGSGEWLAGPGLTAQYGGALLWVATLAIVAQVFCNL